MSVLEQTLDFDFGITGLAALFHQDWRHTAPTPEGLVADWAVQTAGGGPELRLVVEDALMLAESGLSDEDVSVLWRVAAEYFPVWAAPSGARQWMRRLVDVVGQVLESRGEESWRVVPQCIHAGHAADVGRLVGSLSRRGGPPLTDIPVEKAQRALRACAAAVCSDLTLRLLLRSFITYDSSVSPEVYRQIDAIGDEFGYGEYVVSNIDFLVE